MTSLSHSAGTGRPRGLVVARNGDGATPIHECGALCSFTRLVPGEGFSLAIGGVARRGPCDPLSKVKLAGAGSVISRPGLSHLLVRVRQHSPSVNTELLQVVVPPCVQLRTWRNHGPSLNT